MHRQDCGITEPESRLPLQSSSCEQQRSPRSLPLPIGDHNVGNRQRQTSSNARQIFEQMVKRRCIECWSAGIMRPKTCWQYKMVTSMRRIESAQSELRNVRMWQWIERKRASWTPARNRQAVKKATRICETQSDPIASFSSQNQKSPGISSDVIKAHSSNWKNEIRFWGRSLKLTDR